MSSAEKGSTSARAVAASRRSARAPGAPPPRKTEFLHEPSSFSQWSVLLAGLLSLVDYLNGVIRRLRNANARLTGEISTHKEAARVLQHAATRDALTGLPNRQQFLSNLGAALQKAGRHDRKLAVFIIDIDRFKNINDTLGHHAGDRVLAEISARIAASVRESDIVGRFGGDEFAVLLDEVRSVDDCARVARKVLDAISDATYGLDGRQLHFTASIGVSTYPTDGTDMHTLLMNADIAMYRAKDKRESSFEYYSADANRHSIERLSLESDLLSAMASRELLLAYQPKFCIADGALVGFEALLRWQHPVHGLVSPVQFIPLAEESGLIVPIGAMVLNRACEQAARWHDSGMLGENTGVAVNISPRQFGDARLLEKIECALRDSGLPGRLLEVEITEGAVMHNVDRAMGILEELRGMQIQVSIDDFGTGHSSLSYLKQFPINRIKIDKSFVDELPHNADDAAITRTIITMAHNLRLKAIVEGVETLEQLDFMRAHGCDEVQGYYTGRPMFAEQIALEMRTVH